MAVQTSVDKRDVLSRHPLFQHLRDAEMTSLLAHARVDRRRANDVVFRQGDAGVGLVAVLSGQVKITSSSAGGREIVLNLINPGEVFGEMALLDGKPRSADAVTTVASELLVIDRRDFLPFLSAHPDVCIRLMAVLCERLRRTSQQVEDLMFLDLPAHLAKTLLHLAESQGDKLAAGRDVTLKLTQRDLGNLVGRSREAVNRQLRDWQEAGLIRLTPGKIILRDLKALARDASALSSS